VTAEDSSIEKVMHNTKSIAFKDKIKKKFDAYYFFKCEFALSKPNLSQEELEKVSCCKLCFSFVRQNGIRLTKKLRRYTT